MIIDVGFKTSKKYLKFNNFNYEIKLIITPTS